MKYLKPNMITILGPTAAGKTALAARVAYLLGGEVLSADSRQVYRGMDLGTGKDLDDYLVEGEAVPYHLIDLADPGEEYSVFRFRRDFAKAYREITVRGNMPVLCGGSGMYLEAVLLNYRMPEVPEDPELRKRLAAHSIAALTQMLQAMKALHSTTDTADRERLLRAIEIETWQAAHEDDEEDFPEIRSLVFGVYLPRQEVRARITARLEDRLRRGMVEEVKRLLNSGVPAERLMAFGLEYKYLAQYLLGQLSYEEMFALLNTAIHQFAKRQMTWFRRMEKRGVVIHWLDGLRPLAENAGEIAESFRLNS